MGRLVNRRQRADKNRHWINSRRGQVYVALGTARSSKVSRCSLIEPIMVASLTVDEEIFCNGVYSQLAKIKQDRSQSVMDRAKWPIDEAWKSRRELQPMQFRRGSSCQAWFKLVMHAIAAVLFISESSFNRFL